VTLQEYLRAQPYRLCEYCCVGGVGGGGMSKLPAMNPAVCTGSSLTESYDVTPDSLGSGAFSEVFVVIHKATGEKRAVKRIDKTLMSTTTKKGRVIDLSPVETEIALQKECCAETDNIVKIFDIFDSVKTVDIVLEPMLKEDLFDAIENVYYPEDGEAADPADCRYTELEASKIARQLISAVHACHQHDVCHRDLKPENILVHEYHPLCPVVKLCDFGLAARCAAGDQLTEACGTPEYVAPEVILKGGYDVAADIWSIGVILFILLCGEQPFHSDMDGQAATKDVLEQVKMFRTIASKFDPRNGGEMWTEMSQDVKDLLQNFLLVRDPSKRMTAAQLLEHPWVMGEVAPTKAIPQALALHHKRWLRRKFRVAIFTLVATNRIRSLVRSLKVAKLVDEGNFGPAVVGKETIYTKLLADFMAADEVGDSMVDEKQFVGVLQGSGIAPGQELAHFQVFADAFSDQQKKHVNYRDYCIGLVWRCQSSQRTKLQYIFHVFDLDANESIDSDEFILMMNTFHVVGKNERVGLKQIQELFNQIDTNNDGQIDLEEFMAWGQKSKYFLGYAEHVQNQLQIANTTTNSMVKSKPDQQVQVGSTNASGCCMIM